jgi:hypothetical protein
MKTLVTHLQFFLSLRGRNGSHWAMASLCAILLGTLMGCASMQTLIIDVDLEVKVSGRDASGRAWQAASGEIIKQARHPQAGSPFGNVVYQGPVFEWKFGADTGGFGDAIYSKVASPVCMRFDQAQLTSNMQSKQIPLRVSAVWYDGRFIIKSNAGEKRFVAAPSLCFSDKVHAVGLLLDLTELFPSGNNFDIQWSGKDTKLLAHGIGNWLKVHVPIEYEGKREELEVTLTAKDSRGRISYH